ncbi:hypothetical protein GCM10010404_10360 [Nonomuraea africana]|uniref:Uncharacterized protein n=1 Tax=Nonomuraea africana TaxID=46171 RepID=A0ABR9K8I7_9ACTN|nr:hypothetical protein [Nonomuraea africana]MBE1558323.1 hypothetical protein [Nonomuraea africana]
MKIWPIVLLLALSVGVAQPAQAVTPTTKTLVTLHKEGGFAGLDDRVIVYTNGCVRLSRRTGPTIDKCLTGKENRTLRGHLKQLRLGRSEARPQGADFIKYTLAYRGHRASRYTLSASWSPVVRDLEQVLEKYWAPD